MMSSFGRVWIVPCGTAPGKRHHSVHGTGLDAPSTRSRLTSTSRRGPYPQEIIEVVLAGDGLAVNEHVVSRSRDSYRRRCDAAYQVEDPTETRCHATPMPVWMPTTVSQVMEVMTQRTLTGHCVRQ